MQKKRSNNLLFMANVLLIFLFFLLYDYWVLCSAIQGALSLLSRQFFWAEFAVRVLLCLACWACFFVLVKAEVSKVWLSVCCFCCFYTTISSIVTMFF